MPDTNITKLSLFAVTQLVGRDPLSFSAPNYTVSVLENSPPSTLIVLRATAIISDEKIHYRVLAEGPGGCSDRYSRRTHQAKGTSTSSLFRIGPRSGALSVTASLDYETETQYEVHVSASSSIGSAITCVIIQVRDDNDHPPSFLRSQYETQITEEDDRNLPKPILQGSIQTNNKIKAIVLNTYFTSVFTHEDLTEISQPHALNPREILSDGVFTVEEVEKQLSILNPYNSTGPDGLGPRILKETAEVISEPLTNILNRSFETGIVPEDWKRANVNPGFKKGNKKIPKNYRPISLTSVIRKTIERLLKVRIAKHLNDQNLFTDTQYRLREKLSCLINLFDFFGEVNRIYDRRKAVDLVYLDFQKAFDKVPYERHMDKVEAHGVRGNFSRWIRNWLTGRTQRVMFHDQASDSTLGTSGVPQGSVLAPLLFIYINDLDVEIIRKINKFADDTKLCHKAFTERDKVTIESDFNRLLQWTETWKMSFNIHKCSIIHVSTKNWHFQHMMYNVPIEIVQQQRDLGVILTENIKHDKQVEKTSKMRQDSWFQNTKL
ncbi:Cadherin [Trinorchestia longiramus]|nr:Cadherin [Trinorchestia longiramus]